MKPLAACSVSIGLAIVALAVANCASPPMEPGENELAGSDNCATCHEQEARFCRYGAHRTVDCERCHGPGAEHARAAGGPRVGMRLGGIDLCLSCHRQGAENSSDRVATIESYEDHLKELERDHRITLDRRKSGTGCVYCHDPHLLE